MIVFDGMLINKCHGSLIPSRQISKPSSLFELSCHSRRMEFQGDCDVHERLDGVDTYKVWTVIIFEGPDRKEPLYANT
jgi:hypothetical protein